MSRSPYTPELGLASVRALFNAGSPLGPLKVMAERVGRFFQIPLPGFKPYVVFGPDAARKVLVTERDKVLWRNHDPVTDLLRRGVLVTDGEEHDHYRKIMEPSLHPSQLDGYAQMIQGQTERVSAEWQDGQTVDMLVESRKIALLIIMQALFSVDVWNDIPKIWTPTLKAIEYISPGAWIMWRKIPRPGYRKHLKELDLYLYGIIADRRNKSPNDVILRSDSDEESQVYRSKNSERDSSLPLVTRNDKTQDLLQHLIDAGLDDDTIRDQILTMMIAGHDTSTALLAWVFALLGQNTDIYAQLVDELEKDERPLLLDQVIKETLRLYPPIHIGNRMVAKDIDFGEGNAAPAGARMFYSIYLTQRDPSVWENADEFRPARFESGRKTPPMSFIPFGGGPRACIGAAFGQAEARLVLAYLLKNFEFTPLNADEIHPHMGATLEPRPGVLMRVNRRELRIESRE